MVLIKSVVRTGLDGTFTTCSVQNGDGRFENNRHRPFVFASVQCSCTVADSWTISNHQCLDQKLVRLIPSSKSALRVLLDSRTTLRVPSLISGLAHSLPRGSRPGRSSEATTGAQDDRLSPFSPPILDLVSPGISRLVRAECTTLQQFPPNPPTAVVAADRTTV